MPARRLRDSSFDQLRNEHNHTNARLRLAKVPASISQPHQALLTRIEKTQQEQYAIWAAVDFANAAVSHADDALDDLSLRLAKLQLTEPALHAQLFGAAPSRFMRPVLGEQLDAMRKWPAVLEAHGRTAEKKELLALLAQADAALDARNDAEANAQLFRAKGGYAQLLAAFNSTRDALFGALDDHRREHELAADYANRFFLRGQAAKAKSAEEKAQAALERAQEKAAEQERAAAIRAAQERMKAAQAELKALKRKERR